MNRRDSVLLAVCFMTILAMGPGCASTSSMLDIVDRHNDGEVTRFREFFDEAYYDINGTGNMDIVLRRREPLEDNSTEAFVQIVHLRGVWRSIPGKTVAESSQINGLVTYVLLDGQLGTTFEGAGSMIFKRNSRTDVVTGTLDHASLEPARRLAGSPTMLEHPIVHGSFRATRNRRQVVGIVNDIDRRFGLRPPYRTRSAASR